MEAACAEADSNAQVANSPARRATTDEGVTRVCDRRRAGRTGWLASHRPAARLGELGRYGAFSVWRAWGGRKPRRGKARQGKSRYLHTVARRLAGRSGLAGAVVGRPGFCGRGESWAATRLRCIKGKATKGTSRVVGYPWPWLVRTKGKRKSTGHTLRMCGWAGPARDR